jgi:hypothetical protein
MTNSTSKRRSYTPRYRWRIHPDRKDKRTGAINPVKECKWYKYLVSQENKRFRKEDGV